MSEEETLQPTVIGILGNETSEMIDRQLAEMSSFDLNTISDLGFQLSPAADVPAATSTQVEVPLEEEPTHGQANLTSKRRKIHKKTSKEAVRDCTICRKKVAKIGQHLDKVHRNLLPEHRKFLMSFYSTKNARGPVSQCVNCPLRMTNPRRHNNDFPRHIILKVRNKKSDEEFPPQIRELSERNDLGPKSAELLEEYCNSIRESQDQEISQFKRNFIEGVFSKSDHFRDTARVATVLKEYKETNGYTHNSMSKLIVALKDFITWLQRHRSRVIRVQFNSILDEITDYQKRTKKSRNQEIELRKEKRFERVPTLKQVAKLAKEVEKHIVHGVSDDLTYLELASLTVFCILVNSNCRLGAVLSCTSSEFLGKKVGEVIRTRNHKTGDKFENFFEKTPEIAVLVDRCHALYKEETGKNTCPVLLFPNKSGTQISNVAATLKKTTEKLFGTQEFSLNPNSLRKCWETYVHNKAGAIPSGMRRAFRANTGHTDETAAAHYVAPMQEDAIKDLLAHQRDIIRDAVYSAENQIEDDHMDIPVSPGSTDAPRPQHELEVPGPSCSKTIEDDDAYTTDPLYTSASEVTLGTLDTAPQESVNANPDSDSELSTCSTFSLSSVKTRTRIIKAPGRYAKATMSTESKLDELHRRMRTFKGP